MKSIFDLNLGCMKYLRDEASYSKRYDQMTVDDCLRDEEYFYKKIQAEKNEEKKDILCRVYHLTKYFMTGERYLEKEQTIAKWMQKDRERDEKYQKTPMPNNIICDRCYQHMEFRIKDLDICSKNERLRFYFYCQKCRVGKKISEHGRVLEEILYQCPKCSKRLETKTKKTKIKIISTDICNNCDYTSEYVLDLTDKKTKEEKEKEERFLKNRDRFCLSHEKGQQYINDKRNLERLSKMIERQNEENTTGTIYNKLKRLEKLNLAQLKVKLRKALQKEKYIGLEFKETGDDKEDLILTFSIQDDDENRKSGESEQLLKKMLRTLLLNTNWNLMTDYPHYRMGLLTGRLRGTETEEKLIKLIERREKKDGNFNFFFRIEHLGLNLNLQLFIRIYFIVVFLPFLKHFFKIIYLIVSKIKNPFFCIFRTLNTTYVLN